MLNLNSMVETVNAVNQALLLGQVIPAVEALQISRFIASRQGMPGSYGGLFGPADGEALTGYRLFTGDPEMITNASARHILGEEALRILRVLNVPDAEVKTAIEKAQTSFEKVLALSQAKSNETGTFCCGKCTTAYWRALSTGWLPGAEERFTRGMRVLRNTRRQGGWHRMPFFYTVLALTEMPPAITKEERAYVRPLAEARLSRLTKASSYYLPRYAVLTKLLECS